MGADGRLAVVERELLVAAGAAMDEVRGGRTAVPVPPVPAEGLSGGWAVEIVVTLEATDEASLPSDSSSAEGRR